MERKFGSRSRGGVAAAVMLLVVGSLAGCDVWLAGSSEVVVAFDGSAPVELKCAVETQACSGSAIVRVGGLDSEPVEYVIPAAGTAWVGLTLTEAQYELVPVEGSVAGEVRVDEALPTDRGPRPLAVTLRRAPLPVEGATLVSPAVPEGTQRFVDALARDLLGRALTDTERVQWAAFAEANRAGVVGYLVGGDAWLGEVVEDAYARVLDRGPTDSERIAGIAQVRSEGSVVGLWTGLLASDDFYASADGTPAGFVNTAAQRVLFRDLFDDERADLVASLSSGATRPQVAGGMVGSDEARQVRATLWSQKLLSRDPTAAELPVWGAQVGSNGDLAFMATLAAGAAYDALAQERFVSSEVTPVAGTVIAEADEVIDAAWAEGGNGVIVLGTDVDAPAVGGYLVIDDPDGTDGGIGQVVEVRSVPGGTEVTVVAASLTSVFLDGAIQDTTEATDVEVLPVGDSQDGRAAAGDPPCEAEVATKLGPTVGVDVRNASSIDWHTEWAGVSPRTVLDKARIAAEVTPRATWALLDRSLSGACEAELWRVKWPAPLHLGKVTIPGYFQATGAVGVEVALEYAGMWATVSLPCTVGFETTSAGTRNLSGCRPPQPSITTTPTTEGSIDVYAKATIGYRLGEDLKGWAKANIGLDASLKLGIEVVASTETWRADFYIHAGLSLKGELGPWLNLSEELLAVELRPREPLAAGLLGQGTTAGNVTYPGDPSVHPNPPTPTAVSTATAVYQSPQTGPSGETIVCRWNPEGDSASEATLEIRRRTAGTVKYKVSRDGCQHAVQGWGLSFGNGGVIYFVDLSSPNDPVLRAIGPTGAQHWSYNLWSTGADFFPNTWKVSMGGDGNLYAYLSEHGWNRSVLTVLDPITGSEVVPTDTTTAPVTGAVTVGELVPTSDGVAFGNVNQAIYISEGVQVAETYSSMAFPLWDWGPGDTAFAGASDGYLSCRARVVKVDRTAVLWSALPTAPFAQCGPPDVTALPNGGVFVSIPERSTPYQTDRSWLARLDNQGVITWSSSVVGEVFTGHPFFSALAPIADESGNVALFAPDYRSCTDQYKTCLGLRVMVASGSGVVSSSVLYDSEPQTLAMEYVGAPTLDNGGLSLPWATQDVLNASAPKRFREIRLQIDAGSSYSNQLRWSIIGGTAIPEAPS